MKSPIHVARLVGEILLIVALVHTIMRLLLPHGLPTSGTAEPLCIARHDGAAAKCDAAVLAFGVVYGEHQPPTRANKYE